MSEVTAEEKTKQVICEIHGEYTAKVFVLLDKEIIGDCPECMRIRRAEKDKSDIEERERDENNKISRLFSRASLPPRFKDKTFSTYKTVNEESKKALATCQKYAEVFDKRLEAGGGLVLCGKPGTGKTHLAASIANHAIKEFKRSVIFMAVMSAMRRVKSTYSRDSQETESEAIKAFTTPDLLILDEVGVQFGSDAEKMILFEIINTRYQDMKPTILISNLNIKDLEEYIGERVIDRMREGGGAIIAFDWDSYRGNI